MAWQLVCRGFAWQLHEDTVPDTLLKEIVTAMKQKDPLTVTLVGNAVLVLNSELLAHVLIFDSGSSDSPQAAPVIREDGIIHMPPPP